MANLSDFSTGDLLRLFLAKFLEQDDLDANNPVLAKFLDVDTGAIEVDTTVGDNG